jgi:Resolvase, N terminal domain
MSVGRLGRSLRHIIETVTGLADRKIGFRSLTENIVATTANGKLLADRYRKSPSGRDTGVHVFHVRRGFTRQDRPLRSLVAGPVGHLLAATIETLITAPDSGTLDNQPLHLGPTRAYYQ